MDLTRRLNTGNGEQFVILEGYRITDDFRGEAIDQRPVDSPVHALALSPAGEPAGRRRVPGAAPTIDDDDETDIPPREAAGTGGAQAADNVLEHLPVTNASRGSPGES